MLLFLFSFFLSFLYICLFILGFFLLYQTAFLYLASSEYHVRSVLRATFLVVGFGAAAASAYDFPTTVGAAVLTSFLASGNDSLF